MKILIIEDEYSLADAIAETLKKEKFTVTIKTDGEEGEDEALTNIYDLILLDVMLPHKDGFEILNTLKSEKIETPVIMLTAKSEMADKLNGLENGADDYITKPFHMRELIARVKIILRRKTNLEDTNVLEFEDLKLDFKNGKMSSGENEIVLQVKNTGEPIPEAEREKIFERFYRIDKSRNRSEKRYGLGLAIAKSTVEKYNGKIEVICKDGVTNFKVSIPN